MTTVCAARVSTDERFEVDGWELASTPPGAAGTPDAVDAPATDWVACGRATTVAAALRAAGRWTFATGRDLDAEDHWYRTRLAVPVEPSARAAGAARAVLRFEGLATVADVWVAGEHVLHSDNMFVPAEVDVTGALELAADAGADHVPVHVRFAALGPLLAQKRPRPRWKSRLVVQQNLRWFRTSLLGRMPGWTPPAPPIGPWRPVVLEWRDGPEVRVAHLHARMDGQDGVVAVDVELAWPGWDVVTAAAEVAGTSGALECLPAGPGTWRVRGEAGVPGARPWWPHTHGEPTLHEVALVVRAASAGVADGRSHEARIDLGRTGFRTIELDRGSDGAGFGLTVNGVPVFCRGAAWMPIDPVSLAASREELRERLRRVRDAGMNMLRLSGTTVYESDAFHELCDELGILVWQDLMFANLDYPDGDEFLQAATTEAVAHIGRRALSPSLAVVCGGSEVEQQAAMLGLPPAEAQTALFRKVLPEAVAAVRPDVAYVPSTPTGGPLPFVVDAGVGHYYGVGAYRRPVEDARRAGVRFAAECLAFANVPADAGVVDVFGPDVPVPHDPRWKARVPRDRGAGWDFEDVRDHYFRTAYGLDPLAVRAADPARYLELSRVVPADLMEAVLSEWRRDASPCRGALVWTLQDLWPGAGWGLLDSAGRPKAPYHALKRALAPVALLAVDEGVNGLDLWAVNDTPVPRAGTVEIALFHGEVAVAQGLAPVEVVAHGQARLRCDDVLGRFTDPTYAYRFGPPGHDVVVATWRADDGSVLGRAFHLPHGPSATASGSLGLEVAVEPAADGDDGDGDGDGGVVRLRIRSRRFAQHVHVEVAGALADDDHFHVEPGGERVVALRGRAGTTLRGEVRALNGTDAARFTAVVP